MKNSLPLAFLIALLASSCGGGGGGGGGGSPTVFTAEEPAGETNPKDEAIYSYSVYSEWELPPCSSYLKNFLAYIEEVKKLKSCSLSGGVYAWKDIPLVNEDRLKDMVLETDLSVYKAKSYYKKFRKSVYRMKVTCVNGMVGYGTGYKCGVDTVCTNAHVVACSGSSVSSISIETVYDYLDTVNTAIYSGKPPIVKHASRDLAKLILPVGHISSHETMEAVQKSHLIETFDEILSLSFPLGFEDLYSDLGYVKVNYFGECYGQGWQSSPYGCPSLTYDFVTSNDTDHGSSGSPLIDIESGKVVGVTTGGPEGENMNATWAIDADRFGDF